MNPGRESLNRTISASGGFESLQMVSELDIGRCASEEVAPLRGWTRGSVPARTLGLEGGVLGCSHQLQKGTSTSEDAGLEGGWIMRSHIDWGGERSILYKDVETSP